MLDLAGRPAGFGGAPIADDPIIPPDRQRRLDDRLIRSSARPNATPGSPWWRRVPAITGSRWAPTKPTASAPLALIYGRKVGRPRSKVDADGYGQQPGPRAQAGRGNDIAVPGRCPEVTFT